MKIIYSSTKLERQCTNLKDAKKFFGGNESLAISLLSRINAIANATVLKDIIIQPPFHFHKLHGKLDGFFAIDVKTRRDKWRIILCPLEKDGSLYVPCNIDEIAGTVAVVRIQEVSAHYE